MNAKIQRVCNEIEKTKIKISEQQTRLRDLEKQKTELENLEIVSVVRGMNISIAELAEVLKMASSSSGLFGSKAGVKPTAVAPTTENDDEEV
ncbi:MAG: DUF4315 family protein [Defluviitaleaceae bacterium]|nr:DUF4315 family protein [Defluviitaleaceae bacterium]